MKYHKLVRDKVPELILKKEGKVPITHIATHTEYHQKLLAKLEEEVAEFRKSERIDELVDIYEVLDAIMVEKKVTKRTLHDAQNEKAKQRGQFARRIILDEA
jgi:predicted house-cleaning noncanonical NTP pyrophosphatase (MazG superfamily)